jgi:hypothetical protein
VIVKSLIKNKSPALHTECARKGLSVKEKFRKGALSAWYALAVYAEPPHLLPQKQLLGGGYG